MIVLKMLERRVHNLEKAEEFAEWLMRKKKERKLSLRELSRRTGISYSHIHRLSQGLCKPTINTILKIAEALGAKEEALRLFLGLEPAEPEPVVETATPLPPGLRLIPIVAEVPCGEPIEVEEARHGYVLHPSDEAKGVSFAIRARGDSMAPLIMDGDFLLVRQQNTAVNGDIVVVVMETASGWESTVKRYRVRNGEVVLESLNPEYPPIPLRGTRARIIGKVVALKRLL